VEGGFLPGSEKSCTLCLYPFESTDICTYLNKIQSLMKEQKWQICNNGADIYVCMYICMYNQIEHLSGSALKMKIAKHFKN
jgi:hypothetical protein